MMRLLKNLDKLLFSSSSIAVQAATQSWDLLKKVLYLDEQKFSSKASVANCSTSYDLNVFNLPQVDSREVLRNDALLLLIQLTKGNANLQKIVAFENSFDKLVSQNSKASAS